MPATYTYNDAIDDAKREIMKAWEASTDPPETHYHVLVGIFAKLESMKRPSRRKRTKPTLEQEVSHDDQ